MTRPRKGSRAIDGKQSKDWQRGAGGVGPRKKARHGRPSAPRPRKAPPWEVTADDLSCLDAVRSLLTALNDAYVSTRQIQSLVLEIPVLAARCAKRIGSGQTVDATVLDRALTTIGNMGLESELLGLLEDLTTCQADLLEAQARPSSPPA